jgi:hypothetical protein
MSQDDLVNEDAVESDQEALEVEESTKTDPAQQEAEEGTARKLAGAETENTELVEVCDKYWGEARVLVVEDDKKISGDIVDAVNGIKEGLVQDEEELDTFVVSVTSVEGVKREIPKLLELSAGGMLLVVHDLEIYTKDSVCVADPRNGEDSIKYINEEVRKWNSRNPDKKVEVKIVINSTVYKSHVTLFDSLPNVVGGVDEKVGGMGADFQGVKDIVDESIERDIEYKRLLSETLDKIKDGEVKPQELIKGIILEDGGDRVKELSDLLSGMKDRGIDFDINTALKGVINYDFVRSNFSKISLIDRGLQDLRSVSELNIGDIYQGAELKKYLKGLADELFTEIFEPVANLTDLDGAGVEGVNKKSKEFSFLDYSFLKGTSDELKGIFSEAFSSVKDKLPELEDYSAMKMKMGSSLDVYMDIYDFVEGV